MEKEQFIQIIEDLLSKGDFGNIHSLSEAPHKGTGKNINILQIAFPKEKETVFTFYGVSNGFPRVYKNEKLIGPTAFLWEFNQVIGRKGDEIQKEVFLNTPWYELEYEKQAIYMFQAVEQFFLKQVKQILKEKLTFENIKMSRQEEKWLAFSLLLETEPTVLRYDLRFKTANFEWAEKEKENFYETVKKILNRKGVPRDIFFDHVRDIKFELIIDQVLFQLVLETYKKTKDYLFRLRFNPELNKI